MTQTQPAWAHELLQALELEPVDINIEALAEIATTGAQASDENSSLLIGFIAGYAAGMAEGSSMASFARAHAASTTYMRKHLVKE